MTEYKIEFDPSARWGPWVVWKFLKTKGWVISAWRRTREDAEARIQEHLNQKRIAARRKERLDAGLVGKDEKDWRKALIAACDRKDQ